MGRILRDRGDEEEQKSTVNPESLSGRINRLRESGTTMEEDLKTRQGRILRTRESFFESDKGKEMVEDFRLEAERQLQEEDTRIRKSASDLEGQISSYEELKRTHPEATISAEAYERDLFRESLTQLNEEAQLGLTEEDIKQFRGVDPKTVDMFKGLIHKTSTPMMIAPHEKPLVQRVAEGVGDTFKFLFWEEFKERVPFTKIEGDTRGLLSVLGISVTRDVLEGIARAGTMTVMNVCSVGNNLINGKGCELKLDIAENIGFQEFNRSSGLTEEQQEHLVDTGTRTMSRFAELQEENSGHPIWNGVRTMWDVPISDVFDVFITKDLQRGVFNAIRKNGTNDVVMRRAMIEIGELETLRSVNKISEETFRKKIAEAVLRRAEAILKVKSSPGEFGQMLKNIPAEERGAEIQKLISALQKEGSLTAAQLGELQRLSNAISVIGKITESGELRSVPKIMELAQDIAVLSETPVNNLNQLKLLAQEFKTLRSGKVPTIKVPTTTPTKPGGLPAGLSIEEVRPLSSSEAKERMQSFVDDVSGKSKAEKEWFSFDAEGNTIVIGVQYADEAEAIKATLKSAAQKADIDVVIEKGISDDGLPDVDIVFQRQTVQERMSDIEEAARLSRERLTGAPLGDRLPTVGEEAISIEAMLAQPGASNLGISQVDLLKTMQEAQEGAPRADSTMRSLLNTVRETQQAFPAISRKNIQTPTTRLEKAITTSKTEMIAELADIARKFTDPDSFANNFKFLEKLKDTARADADNFFDRLPEGLDNIKYIQNNTGTYAENIFSEKNVADIYQTNFPLNVLDMPSMGRSGLVALNRVTPTENLRETANLLDLLTPEQLKNLSKPEVMNRFKSTTGNLNGAKTPIILLTDEYRGVLLNKNNDTRQAVAMAKMKGFSKVPALVIDQNGAAELLRNFLKSGTGTPRTLKAFAKESNKITPAIGEVTTDKEIARYLRDESMIARGEAKAVGPTEDWRVVIPEKLVRTDLGSSDVWWNTGKIARNRFNIGEMQLIGIGGSDRDVFLINRFAALKVGKQARGLFQNIQALNLHAQTHGLIPKVFEFGDNYIVQERIGSLNKIGQDIIFRLQEVNKKRHDMSTLDIEKEWGIKIESTDTDQEIFEKILLNDELILEATYSNQKLFNDKPIFNFQELFRYNLLSGDILRESTWGTALDGRLVLRDEGALNVKVGAFIGGKEQKFQEIFKTGLNRSDKEKTIYQDLDPHTNYGFTPVPVAGESSDEENGYDVDPWRSAFASAAFGLFTRGKGKIPKKIVKKYLPKPSALPKLPAYLGKVTLNSDASLAKTGETFGGIFPVGVGKSKYVNGIPSLDSKEVLPSMGKADYVFLDRDIASIYGTTEFRAVSSDKVFVIKEDADLRQLARDAGLSNHDVMTGWEKSTASNIKTMREYLDEEGYDAVLVSRGVNYQAKNVDLLDRYFEYDQFIAFNKKNVERVDDPSRRTKKIQGEVMRLVDPPANKVEVDTAIALRQRLRDINKTIKEGKKLGAAETRIEVTARLRNMFSIREEKVRRDTELQRLKTKILQREEQYVRDLLVEHAKEALPLEERGKFMVRLRDAKTRNNLTKAFHAINTLRERILKRDAIANVKKIAGRITGGQMVSADYRGQVRELMSGFDLTARRDKTVQKFNETRKFVEKEKAEGKDVFMTEKMLEALDILTRKSVKDMDVNDLRILTEDLEFIEQLGRAKLRTRKALYEIKKEKIKKDILSGLTPIESQPVMRPFPGERLTKKEQFKNAFNRTHNAFLSTDYNLTPMDTVFDLMGEGKGTYDGAVYRNFKKRLDLRWHTYTLERGSKLNKAEALGDKLKLDERNYERIGVHAAKMQGLADRLIPTKGLSQKQEENLMKKINDISLTKEELEMYRYMRGDFDSIRPTLAKISDELYNMEFAEVENYFPIINNFDAMSEQEIHLRFGKSTPKKGTAPAKGHKKKNVEGGFLQERSKGATGLIKVNAMEIYAAHIDDAVYMKHMAEDLRMLSEITNSPEFLSGAGDMGTSIASDWLDMMARKGGAHGQKTIEVLDIMRRNVGVATLGYKLSSVVIQASALMDGGSMIGRWVFTGAGQVATSKDVRKFILSNDFKEIKDRVGGDIDFLMKASNKTMQQIQDGGYYALKYVDSMTAASVGYGAYLQKLEELGIALDLKKVNPEARDYAQRIVRITQSSSLYKDAPLVISRGRGFLNNRSANRAFFQFQSFMLVKWSLIRNNMWRMGFRGETLEDKKRGVNMLIYLILSLIAEETGRRLSSEAVSMITGGENRYDDEGVFESIAKNALTTIPFTSQMMSIIGYDSNPVPTFNALQSGVAGVGRIFTGAKPETKIKGVVDTVAGIGSVYPGLPGTAQAKQLIKGFIDGATSDSGTSSSAPVQLLELERPSRPSRPERPSR